MQLEIIFLIFLAIWLIILSLLFYWMLRHYLRLSKIDGGNLKKVLDKVLSVQNYNSIFLEKLESKLKKLEIEGNKHIQKIGLVRYNPFNETGGDHSFSLAILSGKQDGLVITGLHNRDKTRVYVKSMKNGKSSHVLSKEESKAIQEAIKHE